MMARVGSKHTQPLRTSLRGLEWKPVSLYTHRQRLIPATSVASVIMCRVTHTHNTLLFRGG